MAEFLRKPYGTVWATTGEIIAPVESKIQSGWVQEMMPYQWENWLTERQDSAISYLLQKGVPEYIASEEYIANKSVVTYLGNVYLAKQTVTNVLPTVVASWKRINPIATDAGVISVAGGGTGATTAAAARTALGVGTLGVQASTNVSITGGSVNGTPIGETTPAAGNFTTLTADTLNATVSGNATTASTLQTARTINGTSFNGSANITTALWGTARTITIGSTGKSLNGSANVAWSLAEIGAQAILPTGTNGQVLKHDGTGWAAGTDLNTTYNPVTTTVNGLMIAADKVKLNGIETGAQVNAPTNLSVSYGSAQVAIVSSTGTNATVAVASTTQAGMMGAADRVKLNGVEDGANNFTLPTGTNGQVLKHNGTTWAAGTDLNTTYSAMSAAEANAGTATTSRVMTAAVLKTAIETHAPAPVNITGNAATATKLQTARTINGVSFDGTANIVLPGSNIVAPGSAPLYACRAWANFDGSGSIRASGNVTSVTNTATGVYRVNLTTAMPDANYVVSVSAGIVGGTSSDIRLAQSPGLSANTAGIIHILVNGGWNFTDAPYIYVSVFR